MAELTEEEWQADVQGRLVALENIVTGLLALHLGAAEPEQLATVRRSFFASLQNGSRPIGDEADLAWAFAAKSLNDILDNVKIKIEAIQKRQADKD